MSENSGGTVRYHRAEYVDENDTWRVWFREHGGYYSFSGAEGEAMGLTPPEPAPLVVTCNGHSIELSDEEADAFASYWRRVGELIGPYGCAARRVAGLLRDARQDPQPASDPAPLSPGECLRGLLAGRTDADELIEHAASAWGYAGMTAHSRLRGAVGDAAREVHG